MSKRTIIFNGINGLDAFDLYVDTIDKKPPEKRENRVSVPMLSGSYNMSKIMGYPIFGDREVIYTCQLIADNSTELDKIVTKINKWLLTGVEGILEDTGTPDYYYRAECTSVIPADNERGYCELIITFRCNPFKIWKHSVSEQKWDDIIFDIDSFHNYDFELSANNSFVIHNECPTPVPLYCEFLNGGTVTLAIGGMEYKILKSGETNILLLPGDNKFVVVSATSDLRVKFDYFKEVL
ncbi:MAG: hypothetical protein HFG29_10335 [Eubacterium sp.]|nr:hypothetical protein [Eubacterium sp.]